MTVKSVRVGVSKAYCRQYFDTEEEGVGKRARCESSDTGPAEQIKRGKEEIDQQVNPEDQPAKLWPAKGQDEVVNIAPVVLRYVQLDEFTMSDPDRDWGRGSFHEVAPLKIHLPPAKPNFMTFR